MPQFSNTGVVSKPFRKSRSDTGTMDGARSCRGNSFPTTCITDSSGVLGATVTSIRSRTRGASAASAAVISRGS